ncbi:MAG: transketolase [Lentisphaerae bacterium]|nr:transketolase [Lentisphaerota bacterium]
MVNDELIKKLERITLLLRYNVIQMIGVGKAGHLGGSSSLAELMAVLYFHVMKIDNNNPTAPWRDYMLLSKGHAALIQYAALCELGFFPRSELQKVKSLDGLLQGHPDLSIPGVEAVTGSLGQGLSISLGIALACRLDQKKNHVYVIMGDGEQSEGQIWEAAMAASNFKVDNLTAFLDWNKVQATGPTENIFSIPELRQKWASFGWEVFEISGHDIRSIIETIEKAKAVKGKPSIIILDTVKGKGFSFAEHNAAFHNGIMDQATYEQALKELDQRKRELDV